MKPKLPAFPRKLVLASSAMLAVLAPLSTSAATFTWTGAVNGSWGPASGNWTPSPAMFGNTADLSFNTVTNGSMFLAFDRTARSLDFGADIDSDVSVSFQISAGGATGYNLTFDTDAVGGNANVTVAAGATGNITLGNGGLGGTNLNPILADNLVVDHNGTGLLLFNRPFQAAAFGITKTGTGTMQTNNFNYLTGPLNINSGTFIANTFGAGGDDLDLFSAINLGGGTLQIGASTGVAKTYNLVPLNVSSPSTLEYKNVNDSNFAAAFTVATCVLNADLTLKNTSTFPAQINSFNIARAITGTGDIIIQSENAITAFGDDFNARRVSLNGNNKDWSGDIVIAKGTGALGGTVAVVDPVNVKAAGTGDIIIGTAASALGAGLTCTPGANVTYANDIIVNTGDGFRAIKGGNTAFNVTFTGSVSLNKDLTVDHTWSATDKRFTLNGAISGIGGLTITRAAGNAGTTVVLTGASNYSGATTVATGASLSLARTCSLTSNITVENTGRIGGPGSTTDSLTLNAGAKFFFFFSAGFAPMNVASTVTLDNSFDINSGLTGGSQGEVIPWANVAPGTYTLIGGTSSTFNTGGLTNNIANFGFANRVVDVGGVIGKDAYFQNGGGSGGGGLQLVVTGPSGYDVWKTNNSTSGGLDEDHDGDGVDNGTEYFLGGSASASGFTPLPAITAGSITWPAASITAGYSGVYGMHFTVETSETLEAGSWVTAPIGTGPDTVAIPFAAVTAIRNVKYTFPTTGPKKFARLKVTGP